MVNLLWAHSRPTTVDQLTAWKENLAFGRTFNVLEAELLHLEESSKRKHVKSVFHGAYRREVFEKVGGFNENLEGQKIMNCIIELEKAGYKICL